MKAWENFLALHEIELGTETVNKWLRTLKVLHFDACNLFLEAKDSFQANWFEEHIRKSAKTRLLNNNNKPIKVHIKVAGKEAAAPRKISSRKNSPPQPVFQPLFDALDPNSTFDRFVPAMGHELPLKVLREICAAPDAPLFNPVYLCGKSGTGKTHLLMAAASALKQTGKNCIYVRAETFTDHVVTAIRAGEMAQFRRAYRNIDVLLIDDVQLFSRKSATQEELFHTFNTLHLAGKPILLAASCTPSELQYVEPRLVSRFEWGIVVPIELPTPEELTMILQKKAEALHFDLKPSIAAFLMESFKRSPKALIRALEALVLRSHMNGRGAPLAAGSVRELLADLIKEEEAHALTPSVIIGAVAEQFGIKKEDILGKAQSRDCVLPRQLAMQLCRQLLKLPYMKIGDLFGRDHSTVISSIKLIKKGIDADDGEISDAYNVLIKQLSK